MSVKSVAAIGGMAVAAVTVSASLFLQTDVAAIPSVIVGLALFLVMASSYVVLERAYEARGFVARHEAFSADIEALSKRADRIDAIARRQDELSAIPARVEKLEAAGAAKERFTAIDARLDKLEQSAVLIGDIEARLGKLREGIEAEGRIQRDKMKAEMALLETLVKQLAEELASPRAKSALPTKKPAAAMTPPPALAAAIKEPNKKYSPPAPMPSHTQEVAVFEADLDSELLEVVRRSVEANKIELYLQPIMTLPPRKIRYYEAFTRLRTEGGDLVLPKDYMRVAEPAGMMPFIDNVMLFRSVQVLKRLAERSAERGMFCNISIHSLLDPEFFPEFVGFMQQNQSLNDSLFFEFSQGVVNELGPLEFESLESLSKLGFRFSLDRVENLDVDFQSLHNRGFRFIKIESKVFVHGMAEVGAHIHAADMRSYLERFGLQLIVEKIETESDLSAVQRFGVRLGQGYLFASPRPVRPEIYRDKAQANAA